MNDATLTLVIYLVSIVVITSTFVVIEVQHIHVPLGALLQALPVLVTAITAIVRAVQSGQSETTPSHTTITTDGGVKSVHVAVEPVDAGVGAAKGESPKGTP